MSRVRERGAPLKIYARSRHGRGARAGIQEFNSTVQSLVETLSAHAGAIEREKLKVAAAASVH